MQMTQHDNISPLPFPQLKELPQPPKKLYIRGELPNQSASILTVVGSRKYTSYGKAACESLLSGLAGHNVSIVSGLALGIDTIAHRTALLSGLHTIAVPGSGLNEEVLYPASNRSLAQEIIESGGALISEYEPDFKATQWSFPQRNRIMAGVAHATLIIEATERSGTLITARLCTEYNRDLMVVPGSIFSESSRGSNALISMGASPVQTSADILDILGIVVEDSDGSQTTARLENHEDLSEHEKIILEALSEPLSRDELSRLVSISVQQMNATITLLEIKSLIKEQGGKIYLCI